MLPFISVALGGGLAGLAGYVQIRLPEHIRNNTRRRVTRLLLLLGGISLGLVAAYWPDDLHLLTRCGVFLGGIGAAHVPLFFLMRRRGLPPIRRPSTGGAQRRSSVRGRHHHS